jgi:hypothetical protein
MILHGPDYAEELALLIVSRAQRGDLSMRKLHQHYDQLTDTERHFVDFTFGHEMYRFAAAHGIIMANDERIERAVDAFARAVIESRPAPKNQPVEAAVEVPDLEADLADEVHLALKGAGFL